MRTEQEKQAAIRVATEIARTTLSGNIFRDRGFSERTVKALVTRGIDAPERLLFATETELKQIPGIGKASFGEIMTYRARFLPKRT